MWLNLRICTAVAKKDLRTVRTNLANIVVQAKTPAYFWEELTSPSPRNPYFGRIFVAFGFKLTFSKPLLLPS